MKKETAKKRIKNAVDKTCKDESQQVKNFFYDLIYLMFVNLELDDDEDYTSTQNLKFAIDVNLKDEYVQLIREAREAE